MPREVTLAQRFKPIIAYPIIASFLAWLALIFIFVFEFSGHYFVELFPWSVAFTAVAGLAWLVWTVMLIIDQRCGGGEDDEDTKADNARLLKLGKPAKVHLTLADRSGADANALWNGWLISTFFTITLGIFIWTRWAYMSNVERHKDLLPLIETSHDFGFYEQESLLDLESSYIVGGGIYAAYGAITAFFAASGRIHDSHENRDAEEAKTN
jgi:hypothetical protein